MEQFFTTGYPKSGTTFLQMLINAHPNIHIPSEHSFDILLRWISDLTPYYEKRLQKFDNDTSKQGVTFNEQQFFKKTLQDIVSNFLNIEQRDFITHSGLHDNSLVNNIDLWEALFPKAKFIFIVREPRNVAISYWNHLRRTSPEFKAKNMSLSSYSENIAKDWSIHIKLLKSFTATHPNKCFTVKYEDLISNERDIHIEKLMTFLNVPFDQKILKTVTEATDFDKLKAKENCADGFFSAGKKTDWKTKLSLPTQKHFIAEAESELLEFDYL